MKDKKTSRVLNDDSFLFGLSYNDITGVGLLLLALMLFSKVIGLESMLWALIFSIGVLALLIPIRLRFRRKIIRDTIKYLIFNGVIRVSKNHRNH